MVQHTSHDWPTTAELNAPESTRNLVPADQHEEPKLEFNTHAQAMTGLASGELKLSRKTRKVMGLD